MSIAAVFAQRDLNITAHSHMVNVTQSRHSPQAYTEGVEAATSCEAPLFRRRKSMLKVANPTLPYAPSAPSTTSPDSSQDGVSPCVCSGLEPSPHAEFLKTGDTRKSLLGKTPRMWAGYHTRQAQRLEIFIIPVVLRKATIEKKVPSQSGAPPSF